MQDARNDEGAKKKQLRTPVAAGRLTSLDDGARGTPLEAETQDTNGQETVIPVVREELDLHKRKVETGKGVRVKKSVSEHEQIIDEPLAREEVTVERVEINQIIESADIPTTRHEGETMIVPILEEILIIEKCTVLKEEVRITRRRREVREPQKVVLRTDEVSVERFDESVEVTAGDAGEHD
jgi:uncharacterized protein (TIGR02271 family)